MLWEKYYGKYNKERDKEMVKEPKMLQRGQNTKLKRLMLLGIFDVFF